MKYVPSWVPGADFQKKAARWKAALMTMAVKPFQHVKEQLVEDYFFFSRVKILPTYFPAEKWHGGAIRGSEPHRASSRRGRS